MSNFWAVAKITGDVTCDFYATAIGAIAAAEY